ncbi:hypothetical protein [Streptomyces pseudoechinosporeus]
MMSEPSLEPRSVYRLLPSMGEFRLLMLEGSSLRKVIRWLRTDSPEDLPTALNAEWGGDPKDRKGEFPSGYPGAPVMSRRIAGLLRDDLLAAGSFLPVRITDSETDEYVLYTVEQVIDCVDLRRSSKPKKGNGEIKKAVFRPDTLPADLPAFRVPEFRGGVYWNGWAVDRLTELLGSDLEARLIWSEDPSLTPHPNPWGF